ncbi:ArgE/DapE family deacylase [Enterococcus saccharolyticus]|uniref:Probable succinyl-diaminopimelate desuccinylase n=1 Tax=Candidatus Enterococcus willemsii TaxID=1857215 RepID=A0ABQ6Z2A0_9ENTE|nr:MULTISPECIES: ArgE/DapE family deacylase [Enterococcus]KAF1305735.1 succinyl-diaminopimelate desuccinylase [Enterococcus sp. CU12B]MCD5001495.1 ArgE/DapE family deacylase [Enterococcus saccharolyticus]
MFDKQRLLELVSQNEQELLDLTAKLLQIPSENPDGDTREISTFILEYLRTNGIEAKTYEPDPNRFNIVASVGPKTGKTLIYCGHSDTVPVGDLEQWDFSPFSGEIKDGYLLGRGASDMKAGLAGLIFSMVILKRYDVPLKGELVLAIVPDEESGGDFGVPWLLDEGIITGDGCLIAEPSSELNPTIGQKGSCWFKLTVNGVPAHGSLAPFVGKNAIVDAIRAIERIRTVTDLAIQAPAELKELLQVSNEYLLENERAETRGVFEKITCNIGTIQGGTSANVVADKCVVNIDCRLPFGITNEETMVYIKQELDQLDIDYTIESFGFKSSANYTPAENPVCRAIVDNISYVLKEHAYGVLQWACSDARHFRVHDIPVLQYGPAELDTIHGFNEKVQVKQVINCAKVYTLAAIDFLNE